MESNISGKILLCRQEGQYTMGYGVSVNKLSDCSSANKFLHQEEIDYANTLKYEQRRHSYLLGRLAAKSALTNITDQAPETISIDRGIFQFPVVNYFRGKSLQVSISHCKNIGVALAYPEEHPAAIDIEIIDEAKIQFVRQQLLLSELEILSQNDIPVSVGSTIFWTLKEGLSKVFRTGLMMDFKIFEIDTIRQNGCFLESTFSNCKQYKGITGVFDPYVISIILPRKTFLSESSHDLSPLMAPYKSFFINQHNKNLFVP